MNGSVLLFPGQGAQRVLMAQDFFNRFTSVRHLFQLASDYSGFNCQKLLFDSTDDELKETEKTQVAVTLSNLASFEALKALGLDTLSIKAIAGFSLGEYAALVASDVVTAGDCFKLVTERGRIMAHAGRKIIAEKGSVAMAAVMGLDPTVVENVVSSLKRDDLFCANYNSPSQIIISGLESAIDAATEPLKAAGAKRLLKLQVSGPFHTPLLHEATLQFESFIKVFAFNNPTKPLYSNVTGALIHSGSMVQELLVRQIAAPVQWMSIEKAIKATIPTETIIIESGFGTVLGGLWKSLYNESINSAATLESATAIFN